LRAALLPVAAIARRYGWHKLMLSAPDRFACLNGWALQVKNLKRYPVLIPHSALG